jgi:DNA-binding CsgD family transcriptional regulator
MLHATRIPDPSVNPSDVLLSILESTELGVVVVDASGRAIYMNASARSLLLAPAGAFPDSLREELTRLHERLRQSGQAIERWPYGELLLRVRARPLDRFSGMTVLELTVAKSATGRAIAEQLARSLRLSLTDARLLALLWQGMSNEEIAQSLDVRVGTIKSRLFRLYHKLGVKRRPAAVLRAAEVLSE